MTNKPIRIRQTYIGSKPAYFVYHNGKQQTKAPVSRQEAASIIGRIKIREWMRLKLQYEGMM